MALSSSPTAPELSKTREEFEKQILEYYYQSSKNVYEWRTREWIQNKIRDVENSKKCERYQVEEICGVKVVKLASAVRRKDLQIVPIEDYFDVIYAAHIFTAHGEQDKIKEYLENIKLFVPHKAIIFFLKLCEACIPLKSQNTRLESFRKHNGFVELIDMSDTPDGKNRFVMHYRMFKFKPKQGHVFLRPLCSSSAVEVAEHLVELFIQFKPPRILYSPNKTFTKALILRLAIVFPDCKFICGKNMNLGEETKDVENDIRKWMSLNNSTEWSKRVHHVSGFERKSRLKKPKEPVVEAESVFDVNLPGPSSAHLDTILKKQPHESYYLQENISADEVFKLLKPTNTFIKITLPKKTQVPNIPQTQKTVVKTYTRKKNEKSQRIIPFIDDKELPLEKKVLVVDRNIREIALKVSNVMKKKHAIWNSALDLPDQSVSMGKSTIGINMVSNANFGTIPKEDAELVDNFFLDEADNVVGQLSSLDDDSSNVLKSNNVKELKTNLETPIGLSELETTERKEEMSFDEADDFTEEKPNLEDLLGLERKYIKQEPIEQEPIKQEPIKQEPMSFETPTTFAPVYEIKVEDNFFGEIVKVESLVE